MGVDPTEGLTSGPFLVSLFLGLLVLRPFWPLPRVDEWLLWVSTTFDMFANGKSGSKLVRQVSLNG